MAFLRGPVFEKRAARRLYSSFLSGLIPETDMCSALAGVRLGSKADICAAISHVRFTPKSGHVRCN
jgi:hypothetical protein